MSHEHEPVIEVPHFLLRGQRKLATLWKVVLCFGLLAGARLADRTVFGVRCSRGPTLTRNRLILATAFDTFSIPLNGFLRSRLRGLSSVWSVAGPLVRIALALDVVFEHFKELLVRPISLRLFFLDHGDLRLTQGELVRDIVIAAERETFHRPIF